MRGEKEPIFLRVPSDEVRRLIFLGCIVVVINLEGGVPTIWQSVECLVPDIE